MSHPLRCTSGLLAGVLSATLPGPTVTVFVVEAALLGLVVAAAVVVLTARHPAPKPDVCTACA
ncbi:hypothetical protein ACFXJ8_41870 [Nonomuraea sp. NPDC059194]|uniref:hypothetical protein n=1 Tax=Nonomuraea sp. NPDC059194 TaxID=3346764 RepID=UPI0036B87E4D